MYRTTIHQRRRKFIRRIRLFGHLALLSRLTLTVVSVAIAAVHRVSCAARFGYFPGPDWLRPSGRPRVTCIGVGDGGRGHVPLKFGKKYF